MHPQATPAPVNVTSGTIGVIMVHSEPGPIGEARVRLAASLAERSDAFLIGVAIGAVGGLNAGGSHAAATLLAADELQLSQDVEVSRLFFQQIAEEQHLKAGWRAVGILPQAARVADLIIVGQPGPSDNPFHSVDVGDLIMRSGRPILVAPHNVGELSLRHAMVAWKDTREARRALADSLPLLKKADTVTLAEICVPEERAATERNLRDVQEYLRRHGVAAGVEVRTGAAEVELLDLAGKASLIVSGAYCHSRLREWVLGGVTRTLLYDSPVCCLLSH